jgi:cyclophilin family peptidyl-prolyl cis-trans isomerase
MILNASIAERVVLITQVCLLTILISAIPSARGQTADGGVLVAENEAKAEFDQRFVEYQQTMRKIEQLRVDYQAADAAKREVINEQLIDAVAAAKARLDAMVAAAVEAYRAAPNADPQITELLTAVARHYAVGTVVPNSDGIVNGGDNYERALALIPLLIEGGAPEKQLPVWGIVAAFVTNDFDLADAYLEQAQEKGLIVDPRTLDDDAEKAIVGLALKYSVERDAYHAAWNKEQAIRAAEAEADDLPRVRLSTNRGEIVVELLENESPQAVANFITLVKQGYYDGLAFHRVLHAFMAQGGDPQGTGAGGPGYSIRCECYQPNHRNHFRGSLSMAHAGRDTGGSQFFLTFLPTTHLDGRHTVFGRVIEGVDVLGDLQKRSPSGDPQRDARLPPPDRILRAEVIRDRGHEYAFEKLPSR